ILIPSGANDQALAQLYIANQIDAGFALQPATFDAARAQNPKLTSWNTKGPLWGAVDGCFHTLYFNDAQGPFSDPNGRLAANYALNRQAIAQLGFQNSVNPTDVPFSTFIRSRYVNATSLKALVQSTGADKQDLGKVASYMAAAGYAKKDGKWAKGGKV